MYVVLDSIYKYTAICNGTLHCVMTTLSVPGENDADNKKKSGSMSDDGMWFGSCYLSLAFYV
jgi:hypothetical protein